jgi:hypothetical protein
MQRVFQRRRVILVLASLLLAGCAAARLWPSSNRPVVLRFLAYTNNGYTGVALFEITNQTAGNWMWSLHAKGREWNHRVAVTELMEPDGKLRHIGSGGPLSLLRHDSYQFATDELYPGETVFIRIKPCLETGVVRLRERLTGWLQRHRWPRAASRVMPGTRVNGPSLPPGRRGSGEERIGYDN